MEQVGAGRDLGASNNIAMVLTAQWSAIEQMQSRARQTARRKADLSDRLTAGLSPEELGSFSQLSMSLGAYVGRDVLSSVGDAGKLLDLICRFQANSFALTSGTDLSNVGVAICPLAALCASCRLAECADPHSESRLQVRDPTARCHAQLRRPNAVVVFPDGSGVPEPLRVIAIRPIAAGEEVRRHRERPLLSLQILTAYVDLALPTSLRQAELTTRYHFSCTCSLCTDPPSPDPRRALRCPTDGCSALAPWAEGEKGRSTCADGHVVAVDAGLAEAIQRVSAVVAQDDSSHASILASDRTLLFRSLAPSSHPLLALFRRDQLAAIDNARWPEALAFAERVMTGMEAVYAHGHPVRAVQRMALAKLLLLALPAGDVAGTLRARKTLLQARDELDVAFGKGGGRAGSDCRRALRELDEEIELHRRALSG